MDMGYRYHFKLVFAVSLNKYSHTSELLKPCTRCILMRKNVSSLSTCSGRLTPATACVSHEAMPQDKTLLCSVLTGWRASHDFQNKLTTSSEVPLYSEVE